MSVNAQVKNTPLNSCSDFFLNLCSVQEEIIQLYETKTHKESTMLSYGKAQDTEQWCGQTLCLLDWSAENKKRTMFNGPCFWMKINSLSGTTTRTFWHFRIFFFQKLGEKIDTTLKSPH